MRIGLQDTDWSYIGAKLAQSDDNEQAEFFKGLAKELRSFETRHQAEMQTISTASKLSREDKEILSGFFYMEGGDQ